MKILVLATDAFGGYGGIAQYNRDLITALNNCPQVQEIEVLVRQGQAIVPGTLAKVRQRAPVQSPLQYSLKAIATALRRPPNVVYCAHLYHGPLAALVARATGARLISQLHGTEVWGRVSPQHVWPLERSDLVLCVSRDTRARICSKARLMDERVIVVSNTVAEVFTPGDRASIRTRLGLDQERMILTVARLDPRDGYKGHDLVIRALPHLVQAHSRRVTYWIAGDGEDRPRLQSIAQDLGVVDRVRFLGKTPTSDLVDLYRAADVFALPSTGEGFGIAFIEAMACGTPAIGLAAGGAPDALGDGELGDCVAADYLIDALRNALDAPHPNPHQLHQAVVGRFGSAVFQRHVCMALERLAQDICVN